MSESKRAQLMPLGPQKEPSKGPAKEGRKTIRISIALPPSTEDTCPEFNYKDEVAKAQKLLKVKEKEPNGALNGMFDDLEEDDDDVRRIARQMEEKYGTGPSTSTKKKRNIRKDDYADIGMGYDESDSFIDNTDGYDEMIPRDVTTLHGGFYINCGALEFKTDDEANSDFSSSSSEDEEPQQLPSRKRVIESSDETDRESKTDPADTANAEKKRKLQNGSTNGVQTSMKKKLLGQNKIYIKKRRLIDPLKKTVKELLREKREDLNMSIPSDLNTENVNTDDEQKGGKKRITASNLTDTIESVVKGDVQKRALDETLPMDVIESRAPVVIAVNSSSDGESSHENKAIKPEVKLPENLPAEIVSIITAIRTSAEENTDVKNSFNSEMNLLILRLERKCKCLGKPSKMKVYEHLAKAFKCSLDFFVNYATNTLLDDEKKRLSSLIKGLQLEINKVMPGLLELYEKDTQRIMQKRSSEGVDNDDNKTFRMPKRRFQWNDTTKKFLKDIFILEKRVLLLEGTLKEGLEAQMIVFLKAKVQILWPEGWMSMNALNKIYTTYTDPKRLVNSSPTITQKPVPPPIKSLPQTFTNTNLSITPIPPKSESPKDISAAKSSDSSVNLSKKPLPEVVTDPISPKKEPECKLKVKPTSELLQSSVKLSDEVIVLDSPLPDRFSDSKSKETYCQVIDLSDKNDLKKIEKKSPVIPDLSRGLSSKHHELSITPAYSKAEKAKPCDDFQTVMENLRVLHKMSSPKKTVDQSAKKAETSPNSSAVSVIAVNKTFAAKDGQSESTSPTMQRFDYAKGTGGYQDEFQKRFLYSAAFNHISANSGKNYNSIDRFPHIASGAVGGSSGDKYFPSANNNYPQSSNGHKSGPSGSQPGFSLFDDMYANLFNQFGYTKEASAPKSQQK